MRSLFAIIALFLLAAVASPAASSDRAPSGAAPVYPPLQQSTETIDTPPPPRGAGASDGALRRAVLLEQLGLPNYDDTIRGDSAVVEVVHELAPSTARKLVAREGGTILASSADGLVEALVPLDAIEALEQAPGVRYVRTPLRASVPADVSPQLFIGDEIAETNADDWHAAGYLGAGVKVGVIDFFDGDLWADAQAEGEVPAPAGTFCMLFGETCDVFDPFLGDAHGIAVSEIIHEMAPEAEIYIAFTWTTSDTQAAVDYFASQGVDIISRSLTSTYDGPGDGTGPLASVVDSAVAQGMVWVNSAGNSASSSGTSNGSYWRGAWNDPDANGFLNFNGADETLGFYCRFLNGVRWSDWAGNATDYDVYIFDTVGAIQSFTPKYTSLNDQTSGFDPLEIIDDGPGCSGSSDVDYLAINLWDEGNGTAGDIIELMGNQTTFEYSQNPYSSSGPAADSQNPGMMAAGALAANSSAIASYSSQGPNNNGYIKPDLAAASCVDSYAYQPGCFAGTSASAPGVAGATALVIGAGLAGDPISARSWLLANATIDRGDPGPDNVYGAGQLWLGTPPPDADGDARTDSGDNCPNWYNPTQALPPWQIDTDDPDCDGFSTADEIYFGTDPFLQCGAGAWPPDHYTDGVINTTDVLWLRNYFLQTVPPAAPEADIWIDGIVNSTDVLQHKFYFLQSCSP
ncbi:MAG TPA: S8 family serine peptidase [Dehalococcoidia bacterium]|nr:S8 family serine peptidase [Dehalococcoidia bacterium]